MDIAEGFEQIAVFINKHSLVFATKQLAVKMPVETLGIDPVDMTHATGDIAVRGLNKQMVMI